MAAKSTRPKQARIPLPELATMTAAQREVHDAIISGPRGRIIGPLRVALHNPSLADRWQKLGQTLRYETSLPTIISELAIIVVGRRWNSQIEFYVHAGAAIASGLDPMIVDDIRHGRLPRFDDPIQAEIYEYTRQLVVHGHTDQAIYDRVTAQWGVVGVVELTSIIGYYSMVALTLNAHEMPLPDDAGPALDEPGTLSDIPPLILTEVSDRG